MRFLLKPDQPARVVFEPWNIEINCPRSIYKGGEEAEIRVWGRRRVHILERLIPISDRFEVRLLGTGLPSFFVAHMDDMTFTLGLSGWTANDWSRLGNFDLMAPRADVDDLTKTAVFDALKKEWFASADALAGSLGLKRDLVLGALALYAQNGRVMYDMNKNVFRARELSREPLPADRLRYSSEREANANRFVDAGLVSITRREVADGDLSLAGSMMDNAVLYKPRVVIDADQRMVQGSCSCHFYARNKLYKGPCEHMLGLRLKHQREV